MPERNSRPIVCYVTDRAALSVRNPVAIVGEKIRGALAAGSDWIQVREKDLSGRDLLELVRGAVNAAKAAARARVIVNDRVDVALAARAGGVHLARESLPAEIIVRWLAIREARELLVGVSCHGLGEVDEAVTAGANYVFFGPIFETPSKRGFGAPQGLARLREACRKAAIPVIAIGGVTVQNAEHCIREGAAGIAAIRLFQEAQGAQELKDFVQRIKEIRLNRFPQD